MNDDTYISSNEAAKLLHVHPETLRRMAESGKLEKVRIQKTPGGHRRYHAGDLKTLSGGKQPLQGDALPAVPAPQIIVMPSSQPKGIPWRLVMLATILLIFALPLFAAHSTLKQREANYESSHQRLEESQDKYGDALRVRLTTKISSECTGYLSSLFGIVPTRELWTSAAPTTLPQNPALARELIGLREDGLLLERQQDVISKTKKLRSAEDELSSPTLLLGDKWHNSGSWGRTVIGAGVDGFAGKVVGHDNAQKRMQKNIAQEPLPRSEACKSDQKSSLKG